MILLETLLDFNIERWGWSELSPHMQGKVTLIVLHNKLKK